MGYLDSKNFINGRAKQHSMVTDIKSPLLLDSIKHRKRTILSFFLHSFRRDSVIIPSIKSDIKSPHNNSFIWFGHSSYMLWINNKSVLIDPILEGSASPMPFMFQAFKGADIYRSSDLPQIDFLLITHNHYDHLSLKTLRGISSIKIAILPLGMAKYLKGFSNIENIIELDWEKDICMDNIRFYCLPTRHYSARGILDSNKSLWACFVIEYVDSLCLSLRDESINTISSLRGMERKRNDEAIHTQISKIDSNVRPVSNQKIDSNTKLNLNHKLESTNKKANSQHIKRRIFCSGDSGYGGHFKEIGKIFNGFDFAFIENGQYNAAWKNNHLFPIETLQAALDLRTKRLMPIHNSKFKLAPHKWNEPLESIHALYTQNAYPFSLITPLIGEIYPLWSDRAISCWWQ